MTDGPGQEELELLHAAQNGDAEAFGRLYELYAGRVFRYLYAHLDNRLDAEDITEEVFLRTWQALPGYRQRGAPLQAFIFRVAHNALMDHYRKTRRQKPAVSLEDERFQIQLPDQAQGLEYLENRQHLRRLLGKLRRDYRMVIDLRFLAGLSLEESAQVMNRSQGALRVLQHRAVQALRKLVEQDRMEE
jgi:RNA polymerase sigma-70 factor (ECF subfamily)